ncbi:TPA: hypothetical protein QDB14_004142 [Burkholderia vietnamiensis]|nr:hypothetical protein [Burkholderia vietnamiensis]
MPQLHLTISNVRSLPARVDSLDDRLQAAADDAALARQERNAEIADGVTFDAIEISATDCALIDAALARGRIEDVYAVWNILVAARDAEIARRIAAPDHIESHRFPTTYCSQCGTALGHGNAGVSSCSDHHAGGR